MRSIQTKLNKTRRQTQNSKTKNRGAGVEHRGVYAWNVRNKPKTRKQNRGVGVEHRGVCVECSKQTQNSKRKILKDKSSNFQHFEANEIDRIVIVRTL